MPTAIRLALVDYAILLIYFCFVLGIGVVLERSIRSSGWIAPKFIFHSEMGQNFWMAIVTWSACFALTLLISLTTTRTKTDEELVGLVYSLTPKPEATEEESWYQRPVVLGVIILAATLFLNLFFA